MKNVVRGILVAAMALGAFATFAWADETAAVKIEPAMSKSGAYPLDYCIVSGEKLGEMGDPVVKTIDGREVKFCCNSCVGKYEKDQASFSKKLDDAIIAAEKPNYPVETCVVSGEPLGHSDMGDPVDLVYQNRLVRFCCNNCVKAFKKDPDKFFAKLDEAAAKKGAADKNEVQEQKQ